VFAKGSHCQGIPSHRVDQESAEWMVKSGAARWVNSRHKNVIMLVDPTWKPMRDLSCQMGPGVTQAVIEGSRYHEALLQGWAPVMTNGARMMEGHNR